MSCCCSSMNCGFGECPFASDYSDSDYREDITVLRQILQDARDEVDELEQELDKLKGENRYLESVVSTLEHELHSKQ